MDVDDNKRGTMTTTTRNGMNEWMNDFFLYARSFSFLCTVFHCSVCLFFIVTHCRRPCVSFFSPIIHSVSYDSWRHNCGINSDSIVWWLWFCLKFQSLFFAMKHHYIVSKKAKTRADENVLLHNNLAHIYTMTFDDTREEAKPFSRLKHFDLYKSDSFPTFRLCLNYYWTFGYFRAKMIA